MHQVGKRWRRLIAVFPHFQEAAQARKQLRQFHTDELQIRATRSGYELLQRTPRRYDDLDGMAPGEVTELHGK